ncbi:MAG: uracil-DNA glycosylase [Acidobacteriota bacterium]|jgi:uracil-DNA glycosylase family 4|nr:MAG: uracil-DNA glycosylase [Acidobacteriota bacterium]
MNAGGSADSLDAIRADVIACQACPRLREYCARVARERSPAHRHDTYWGRPVPAFGDPAARLILVGLAPAAHGANRTGRMFTGDVPGGAADFLMEALHACRFASQPFSRSADDGLQLHGLWLTAAVRCAPPQNRPLPEEVRRCAPYLARELALLPETAVVVALGRLAFDVLFRLLGEGTRPRPRFEHGGIYRLASGRTLVASYHPSRQNTNTGKLTQAMLRDVLRQARRLAG